MGHDGGGGGGGRIAIYCTTKQFQGTLSSAAIFDSKFNLATMNVADQTIRNWWSSSTWMPISKYEHLIGGPGTIYQDCGADSKVLTLDNIDSRVRHHRNSLLAADEASNVLDIIHLKLLNRARAEFQSMAKIDQLSGDNTNTAVTVHKHAQLITLLSLTVTGGVHLFVAGHLARTKHLVVLDNSNIHLLSTGFTDSEKVNHSTSVTHFIKFTRRTSICLWF